MFALSLHTKEIFRLIVRLPLRIKFCRNTVTMSVSRLIFKYSRNTMFDCPVFRLIFKCCRNIFINSSLHFIIPMDVGTQTIEQRVLLILDNQFRYHKLWIWTVVCQQPCWIYWITRYNLFYPVINSLKIIVCPKSITMSSRYDILPILDGHRRNKRYFFWQM